MKRISLAFIVFSLSLLLQAQTSDPFRQYWYSQKAELTRFTLEQARYGEVHKGEAVLIYVTEPFLTDKQVKYEHGDKSKSLSVLKLNSTRKFFTGIYPYSMMTSIFTPVDFKKSRTLKISSTSQEWCGHTFMQLNYRNNNFDILMRSYFQDEGDKTFQLPEAWLEDEIWTRLRLAPETLPQGEFEILPAFHSARLQHRELKREKAVGKTVDDGKSSRYVLEYKTMPRMLTITYSNEFPYQITGWQETGPGGFEKSQLLTTKAVKTKTILLDYWNRNGLEDAHYRKELGLTQW